MDDDLVLPAIVKAMLAASGDPLHARLLAAKHRAPERAVRILEKAAIGSGHLGDGDFGEVLGDWKIATAGFFAAMRTKSVFFRLWDQGFRRVPARTNLGIVALNASAWASGEGAAKPISRMSLSSPAISPRTATGIIVTSTEVARSMDPAAQTLVTNSLRDAVGDVVDETFLASVTDSGTLSQPGSGYGAEAMKADLHTLLSAVNLTGAGSLFWVLAPDVANGASILDQNGSMSPTGGELVNLPALVSTALPQGTIRLLDAAEIAAALEGIEFDMSGEAAIEMLDAPVGNSTVPASAAMVSLWQAGAVAMKVDVRFAVERLRGSAVAELTDVAWTMPAS